MCVWTCVFTTHRHTHTHTQTHTHTHTHTHTLSHTQSHSHTHTHTHTHTHSVCSRETMKCLLIKQPKQQQTKMQTNTNSKITHLTKHGCVIINRCESSQHQAGQHVDGVGQVYLHPAGAAAGVGGSAAGSEGGGGGGREGGGGSASLQAEAVPAPHQYLRPAG